MTPTRDERLRDGLRRADIIAAKMARRYWMIPRDEWEYRLALRVARELDRYAPERTDWAWSTYIQTRLNMEMRDILRTRMPGGTRASRNRPTAYVPIHDEMELPDPRETVEAIVVQRVGSFQVVTAVFRHLSSLGLHRTAVVYTLMAAGCMEQEIADVLGVSVSTIAGEKKRGRPILAASGIFSNVDGTGVPVRP